VLSVPITLALWSLSAQQPAPDLPDAVGDYAAYLRALELEASERHTETLAQLEPVWTFTPPSPLVGRAALVAARAHLALGQPAQAAAFLRRYTADIPRPEGLLLLAAALDAAGDRAAAVATWQRVYYEHPLANEADEAGRQLDRLRGDLTFSYPPAMPQAMIARAEKFAASGQQSRARREYEQMIPFLAGRDRDIARIRARAGNYRLLADTAVGDPDAEAERLYRMHAAARSAKADAQAEAAVRMLAEKHPDSPWRLEALVSLGNMYLLRNDGESYERVFRACYDAFPANLRAAYCHWKVAWRKHTTRAPDAAEWMREHLASFPKSEKSSAALYFLGRYGSALDRFPMSYYAVLSRRKLKPAPPPRIPADTPQFEPGAALRVRLHRAGLLEAAELAEWAEFEIRYAAENEGQPFAAALALAGIAHRRGAWEQGIRYIKAYAKGYLSIPLEAAPDRFWRAAFPLPYRGALETYGRARSLDPFLLAALIRQESEFDPRAVSLASAYGLMQVLPSTGRQLSRRVGIAGFRPAMLFQPDINIRLGVHYFAGLLDTFTGEVEQTLAAYNAGKSRVDNWLAWAEYREPAEFIETIPFTETREYVQVVLRNADIYRRLYGGAR
jgi:soluble lytic murein transglycosylase